MLYAFGTPGCSYEYNNLHAIRVALRILRSSKDRFKRTTGVGIATGNICTGIIGKLNFRFVLGLGTCLTLSMAITYPRFRAEVHSIVADAERGRGVTCQMCASSVTQRNLLSLQCKNEGEQTYTPAPAASPSTTTLLKPYTKPKTKNENENDEQIRVCPSWRRRQLGGEACGGIGKGRKGCLVRRNDTRVSDRRGKGH